MVKISESKDKIQMEVLFKRIKPSFLDEKSSLAVINIIGMSGWLSMMLTKKQIYDTIKLILETFTSGDFYEIGSRYREKAK